MNLDFKIFLNGITELVSQIPPVIITAMAGVVVAIITLSFSEPRKNNFVNRFKKRQIKTAIYKEIMCIYLSALCVERENRKYQAKNIVKITTGQMSAYNWAKSEPAIFYQLEDYTLIHIVYAVISLVNEKNNTVILSHETEDKTNNIILAINAFMENDLSDKKLLKEISLKLPVVNDVDLKKEIEDKILHKGNILNTSIVASEKTRSLPPPPASVFTNPAPQATIITPPKNIK